MLFPRAGRAISVIVLISDFFTSTISMFIKIMFIIFMWLFLIFCFFQDSHLLFREASPYLQCSDFFELNGSDKKYRSLFFLLSASMILFIIFPNPDSAATFALG